MFTHNIVSTGVNKETGRILVKVEFLSSDVTVKKEYSFAIGTDLLTIKRTIKSTLDELNAVIPVIPTGVVDLTVPEEVVTPVDTARTTWETDKARLQTMQELVDMGVFTGIEPQIVALRKKVRDGFKADYLG